MAIERKNIVAEAIALLDEVGIDNLTTRRLADRLGVKQPALYWHFKSKRALLDAVNEEIMSSHLVRSEPKPGDDWRSFLLAYGGSVRDALLAHRDGGRVHAGAPPPEDQPLQTERQLAFLRDEGFSELIGLQTLLAINCYVLGSVIDQQADEEHDLGWDRAEVDDTDLGKGLFGTALGAMKDGGRDAAFAVGLNLIVDGLVHLRQVR